MDNHRLGHATMAAPDRSDSIIRRLEVHDPPACVSLIAWLASCWLWVGLHLVAVVGGVCHCQRTAKARRQRAETNPEFVADGLALCQATGASRSVGTISLVSLNACGGSQLLVASAVPCSDGDALATADVDPLTSPAHNTAVGYFPSVPLP